MKAIFTSFVLLPFLLLSCITKSQTLIPFPEPGLAQGVWYSGNFYHSPANHSESFKYIGDTIFNSHTYSQLCIQDWFTYSSCINTYPSYSRYDNGKIYLAGNLTIPMYESLMYDFSLNVGDSFNIFRGYMSMKRAVSGKTQVTTADGVQRWRIKFNGSTPADTVVWLEGVGDIQMGLFATGDFEGGWSKLICQYTNKGFAYGNATGTPPCDSLFSSFPTGIVQNMDAPNISVYPNPAGNQLFISADDALATTVRLYDITGQLLLEMNQPFLVSLDISNFKSGVYLAEIKTTLGSTKRRFVKI